MTELEVRREGGATVVTPTGNLLASSVPQLRTAMRDLVRSGVREMVVDLERTTMVDSAGLGLLLSAYNSIHAAGGGFSVVHACDEILELFRSMRIHQHFGVSGRQEKA
jgi:anti-anti-sigma factor